MNSKINYVNSICLDTTFHTYLLKFEDGSKKTIKKPILDGIIKNPFNNKESHVEKFLIDTGADITVLNLRFADLFVRTDPIGSIKLTYGGNTSIPLNVYEVELAYENNSIKIHAVLDCNLKIETPLLGRYKFLDEFDHLVFNNKKGLVKLIKGRY